MEKKPIIVVCGPTACKKTETAINIAKEFDGEVISADSMQIYKYMDIGTAKPTVEERQGITHHLIDELYPDESYSAADFKNLAKEIIEGIYSRGKLPIIAGGTGFYINAILRNTDFVEMDTDFEYRDSLWEIARTKGNAYLYSILKETDPKACETIHENNVKRVVRALEYYKLTNKKISEHNICEKQRGNYYNAAIVKNFCERQRLYDNINKRVDKMVGDGLEEEVKTLLHMGYQKDLVSMQGIGYKEMIPYLNGEYALEEAIYNIKINTRHFAKRQLTWFRLQMDGEWFDIDDNAMFSNIKKYINEFLKGSESVE